MKILSTNFYLFMFYFIVTLYKEYLSDSVKTQEEVVEMSESNIKSNNKKSRRPTKEDSVLEDEVVYKDKNNDLDNADPYAFSREWEEKMSNYEPSYVYMIPIKHKTIEKFYENFSKVPRKIKGAFLTEDTKKEKIELVVLDPKNKIVYKNYTSECIFEFEVNVVGEYAFRFKNNDRVGDIKVTFTMNTAQEELLNNDHLSFTEKKIESLNKFINNIKVEDGFIMKKQRNQKKSKNLLINYVYHY